MTPYNTRIGVRRESVVRWVVTFAVAGIVLFLNGDRIGELIGRGGMGEVYRPRDTRLKRDAALEVRPSVAAGE